MSPQWIPQNIQKRLLRYVLQQLSVFSEIDLSDLDVSLGNVTVKNVLLNPETFNIPGMFLRSGQIGNLNLQLTTDGVVVNCDEIEIILVLANTNQSKSHNDKEFSLAQSRADLASSVMGAQKLHGDEVSDDDSTTSEETAGVESNEAKKPKSTGTFYSSYVNKAVEIALSKLQFNIKNVLVKIVINESGDLPMEGDRNTNWGFYAEIDKINWVYENEKSKCVNVEGFRLFTEVAAKQKHTTKPYAAKRPGIGKLEVLSEESGKKSNVPLSDGDSEADTDEDSRSSDEEAYNQMMTSSFLSRPGDTKQKADESDDDLSSAMFMSANSHLSQTMMMTMNKLREGTSSDEDQLSTSYKLKKSVEDNEKEKLFDSIYETATGSGVMPSIKTHSRRSSRTSMETMIHSVGDLKDENKRYFLAILKLTFKFSGLMKIDNLEVIASEMKMSFKHHDENDAYISLFDTILNFIRQYDKYSKSTTALIKRSIFKMRTYSNLNEGPVVVGQGQASKNESNTDNPDSIFEGKIDWFSKLTVDRIAIDFDSYISKTGEFTDSSNSLMLFFDNISVVKKNSTLIFGGISKISVKENEIGDILNMETDEDKSDNDDLRFEYLLSNNNGIKATNITVLCSKIINFKLNSSIIEKVASKVRKITPIVDALHKLQTTLSINNSLTETGQKSSPGLRRQPGASLASSLVFQKSLNTSILPNAGSENETIFTFQSNIVNVSLALNSVSLRAGIFPINYCSKPGLLSIPKILVYQMKDNIQILIAKVVKVSLTQYSKFQHHQVHSFDVNNKETNYTTEAVAEISSIVYTQDYSNLKSIITEFKEITSLLSTNINDASYSNPSGRNNRKVRISNTVSFANTGSSIKFHLNILQVKATIENIESMPNDERKFFGDLQFGVNSIHVNFFADDSIQLLIKNINVLRIFGPKLIEKPDIFEESLYETDGATIFGLQELLVTANPEDNILPMFGIKFASQNGKGFLRNTRLEYHASWLSIFDTGNTQETEGTKEPLTSAEIPKTNSTIKIRLVDCVLGLNPSRLSSKGMLVIDRGDVDIISGAELFVKSSFRNVSLLLIDDTANICGNAETKKRRQWVNFQGKRVVGNNSAGVSGATVPSWSQLSWNISKGFITIGTINALNLSFIKNSDHKLLKMAGTENPVSDLKIDSDLLKLELCADSSQAFMQLIADLKEPLILSDGQKFRTTINGANGGDNDVFSNGIDVFDEIDEEAFLSQKSHEGTILLHRNSDDNLSLDSDGISNISNGEINIVDDYYAYSHNSPYESSSNQDSPGQSVQSQPVLTSGVNDQKLANDILSSDLNNLKIKEKATQRRLSNNTFFQAPGDDDDSDNSVAAGYGQSSSSSLSFANDYFQNERESKSSLSHTTVPMKIHFILQKGTLLLYDGFDWSDTRKAIKRAVHEVEQNGLKAFNEKLEKTKVAGVKDDELISDADMEVDDIEVVTAASDNYYQAPVNKKMHRRDSLGDFGFRPIVEDEENSDGENDPLYPLFGTGPSGQDVIDRTLFDSIHISLPMGANPNGLANGINKIIGNTDVGSIANSTTSTLEQLKKEADVIPDSKTNYKKLKLRRSKSHKIRVDLFEVDVDCVVHTTDDPSYNDAILTHDETENDAQVLLSVDVKVDDFEIIDNVPTSTWNKFVSYMKEAGDREVGVCLFRLNFVTYRPVASLAATESVLKVSVLPLRLHVDQDALEFLTRFGGFKDKRFLFDPIYDDILYIQKFQVNSVHLKLDYKPKKVDYFGIRSGNTTEFMNFFILDGANITLRKAILYGVDGLPKLNDSLNDLWMPDIRSTQLKGIISGLTPSLSKIGGGIKNLVVIPVNEYKKDGRLVNSIQRGAYAFVRTTGNELLRFGVKIAAGTQTLLENTEEALGGTGAAARLPVTTSKFEVRQIKERDDHFDRLKSKSKKRVTDLSVADLGGSSYVSGNSPEQYRSRRKHDTSSPTRNGYSGGRYYSELFSDSEDDDVFDNSDNESEEDEDWDLSDQQKTVSLYANQPVDTKEGLSRAATSLERNFVIAKDTLVKAGGTAADSGSAKKALYVLARAAPVALIRPMIGTTEAISKTLLGVTNQINPEQGAQAKEKYKPIR